MLHLRQAHAAIDFEAERAVNALDRRRYGALLEASGRAMELRGRLERLRAA